MNSRKNCLPCFRHGRNRFLQEKIPDSKPELHLEFLETRLLLNGVTSTLTAEPAALASTAISAPEQLFIYLLNRARSDPQAYEVEVGLPGGTLAAVAAQPPLAFNDLLQDSARFHAQEMADNNYFGHQSQVTGDWPNKMAIDAGYILPWGPNANNIESLAAGYGLSTAPDSAEDALRLLIEDAGVPSLGHRIHLLAMDPFWQQHREVGVGYAFNNSANLRNYWAIHTAYENASDLFLTGVVYNDKNGNDRYDLNEGLAGVTVSTDQGGSVLTNPAGGWSLPVTGGTYLVTAAGGAYNGTGFAVVLVDNSNVEVDFTSGEAQGVIGFGLDSGSSLPKVSLTAPDSNASESPVNPALFTFTRTGETADPLLVNYSIAGSATNGVDYVGLAGSITIPAGVSSISLNLNPLDDSEIEGQETVILTLAPDLNYQFGASSSATALIADDEGIMVTITNSSLIYTEPDGTVATLTIKSGSADLVFQGDNLAVQPGKKTVITAPSGASLSDITLHNTSSASSLAFKASGGNGFFDVENITVQGSLKDIQAKPVNLQGDLTITGSLNRLEFHNVADQHLIAIGPPVAAGRSVNMKFSDVADLTIQSQTPIQSLVVNNWQDTDGMADAITAPWIGKLSSSQNFSADINAQFLNSLTVKGNYTHADLMLTQPLVPANPKAVSLAKLAVLGAMDHVLIRSANNMGSLTVGRLFDSSIFAGVNPSFTGLPDSPDDFEAAATLGSVTLKGSKTETVWLRNSNIAAFNVTKAVLGFADPANGGVPYGLAARQFKSITYTDAAGKIKASAIDDFPKFNNLGDLEIRMIV